MRSDWMCTTNAQDRLFIRVFWCADCVKWHCKLSWQQLSEPSSRRWQNIAEDEQTVDPQEREWGFAPLNLWPALSELQRLYAEREDGVRRLF